MIPKAQYQNLINAHLDRAERCRQMSEIARLALENGPRRTLLKVERVAEGRREPDAFDFGIPTGQIRNGRDAS